MANLSIKQVEAQPKGKYFQSSLGASVFYGRKELKRKEDVADFQFQPQDCDELAPCSIDMSPYTRTKEEAKNRLLDGKYDDRETLSGVYQGSVIDSLTVGRQWTLQLPKLDIAVGLSWGDRQIKTAEAFSGMALSVPQAGSFKSFNALQAVLGQSNLTMPMELMGAMRMMDQAESNSVRFVWRLAIMYVAAKLREAAGKTPPTVTGLREAEFVSVSTVQQFVGVLENAVAGTNYVPFVQHNFATIQGRQASLLLTACSASLALDGQAVLCWPQIPNLKFLYHGTSRPTTHAMTFNSSEVWQTAVAWCVNYSHVDLLHEAVKTILTFCPHDGSSLALTNLDRLSIELPLARMQPLSMALVLEPRSVTAADLAEPAFAQLVDSQLALAQIMGVLYWYWVWHGPVFYSRLRLLEASDQAAFYSVLVGNQGQRAIWTLVQKMMAELGIKGNIGRILCTTQTVREWNSFINVTRKYRRSAVQWEELAVKLPKISAESALWGRLYPLVLEEAYIPGQWGRVGQIKGARSPAECMYSVYTPHTNYRIRVLNDDGTAHVLDYTPDRNYRGDIADYQFFTTNDKWGRTYTPMFKLLSNDYYHMLVSTDSIRFKMVWYIDRAAFRAVADVVSYQQPEPPGPIDPLDREEGVPPEDDGDRFGTPDDGNLPPPKDDESMDSSDYISEEENAANVMRPTDDYTSEYLRTLEGIFAEHGGKPEIFDKIKEAYNTRQDWTTRQLVDAMDDYNIIGTLRALPESKRAKAANAYAQALRGVLPMSYSNAATTKLVRAIVGLDNASMCLARHGALNISELPETLQKMHKDLYQQRLAKWEENAIRLKAQGKPIPEKPKLEKVYSAQGVTDEALLTAAAIGVDAGMLIQIAKTGRMKQLISDAFTAVNAQIQATVTRANVGDKPANYTDEEWEMLMAVLDADNAGMSNAETADTLNNGAELTAQAKDTPPQDGSGTQGSSGTISGGGESSGSKGKEPVTRAASSQETKPTSHSSSTSRSGGSGRTGPPGSSVDIGQEVASFTFSDPEPGNTGLTPSNH